MQEEEGGRERERETGGGRRVSEQEKMRHRERERERERESVCVCVCKGVLTSFQNRPPNISLLSLSSANGWQGPPFLPLFLHLLSFLPFLLLQLFGPGNNGESWHHDCKMFQFSFQHAFTSLLVCVCVCVWGSVVGGVCI